MSRACNEVEGIAAANVTSAAVAAQLCSCVGLMPATATAAAVFAAAATAAAAAAAAAAATAAADKG